MQKASVFRSFGAWSIAFARVFSGAAPSALALLGFAIGATPAQASVDSIPGDTPALRALEWDGFRAPLPAPVSPAIAPEEAFLRGQAVLRYFGVPDEGEPPAFVAALARKQSAGGLRAVAPILDPQGELAKMYRIEGDQARVYQDPGALETLDFAVDLAPGQPDESEWAGTFHERLLRAARENPADRPLAGLRIALDPGHMGGDYWDGQTGKFVLDHRGHKLSEGVMNLQTTMLLEQRFQALGAETMITHRSLAPVTDVPYQTYDLHPYALRELRENTLLPWFQSLLGVGPEGAALYQAFASSPQLKAVLADSDINRSKYFILREDLDARSRRIEEFGADLVLVIHYDAGDYAGDPHGLDPVHYDGTKAYVVGSDLPEELSSREDRWYLARHLLDARAWDASLKLGRSIVGQMHSQLGLGFDHGGGGVSSQVEPGIFARNLVVSRKLGGAAVSYVECLHYDDPTEFAALLEQNHPMTIDGEPHPYSDRLAQVARAIGDAVVSFVTGYSR